MLAPSYRAATARAAVSKPQHQTRAPLPRRGSRSRLSERVTRQGAGRAAQIRMVEGVIRLHPDTQFEPLGHREGLRKRRVDTSKVRTREGVSTQCASPAQGGDREL